ncbi:MFS transporter [Erysipelothrix larvae]|uniref:MFS transporter n=1 Tax=Erysipelothrix larvae TaxID=1514105 RepID=UPI000AC86E4F|nr:MFS transporter [Erysipelothrix larvae]
MKNNQYFKTSLGLYMNYFVQGMQAIIISQNASFFADKWGTDSAGVLGVIAIIGIGKVIILLFSGFLSDYFGRKPLVYIGMAGYLFFFGGLLVANSVTMASIVAFSAGAATSFLDAATYPALMEIYPDKSSVASVIVKGFISVSGFIFPLFVGLLTKNNVWIGISILVPLVIVALNVIYMLNKRFPDSDLKEGNEKKVSKLIETHFANQPRYYVEGAILLVYAFVCMACFYSYQQVITLYGQQILMMDDFSSRLLLSLYTLGSFCAVISTSIIMAKFKNSGYRDPCHLYMYNCNLLYAHLLCAKSTNGTCRILCNWVYSCRGCASNWYCIDIAVLSKI